VITLSPAEALVIVVAVVLVAVVIRRVTQRR
jgi:hypothetical protein